MPGDIEFSEEVSTMLFVLLGERPLQADSDLAYGSRLPFQDYGDRLRDLSDKIRDSLSSVQGALPPQVAEQYIQAMGMLTGTNGVDHFGEFVKQLKDLADGQIEQVRPRLSRLRPGRAAWGRPTLRPGPARPGADLPRLRRLPRQPR
ncbi:hypothetical protein [Streptomyces sp. NPDC029004]|uniref:hypothetical protein n=1 Tax=Streptomyces sp. NPDC029004 TaxID=3154490 RepID=UPI0033E43FB8